ncbi:RloB family protein [Streptomyces sp. NBC_01429]|uniref:RloB family protein n=1 Tax=Streptomyces sp. NBC_01429 TaxID=2903862 RepID=UPI002E2B6696|nr:RloB family protein [Streptomyces sp. NBC_01429]
MSKGDEQPLIPTPTPPPDASRAVRVAYVGCEGESTEVDHLNHLNDRYGDGSGYEGQRFHIQPVYKKNGYTLAEAVAAVRDEAAEDEAWALFDRDDHHDIPKTLREAAEGSTEVCFSHPSFELWLLLHFQEFGGRQSGKNKDVIKKLRQAHPAFKKFDGRNDKSIKDVRRTALDGSGTLKEAVSRAKRLVGQCEHGSCKAVNAKTYPYSRDNQPKSTTSWAARSGHAHDCETLRRDPSTDVWRLVVSLGIVEDSSRSAASRGHGYSAGPWGGPPVRSGPAIPAAAGAPGNRADPSRSTGH